MREIKFRLIKNKKIVGFEWFFKGRWYYSKDGEIWTRKYIKHDEKNIFVGMDKNKKEIYERDFIKKDFFIRSKEEVYHNESEGYIIGEVRCGFSIGRYLHNPFYNITYSEILEESALNKPCFFTRASFTAKRSEVVGNVYETPNLIEKEIQKIKRGVEKK